MVETIYSAVSKLLQCRRERFLGSWLELTLFLSLSFWQPWYQKENGLCLAFIGPWLLAWHIHHVSSVVVSCGP